jgi:hypothetical protein
LAEARRVVAERPEEAVEGRHSVRRLTNPLSFPGTAG